jgi:signal transduction histidine kinase
MWITLATEGAWAPPIFVLLSTVPLIFPNGSLPSRRWRIVIWASTLGIVCIVAGSPFEPNAIAPLRNPIANQTIYDVSNIGAPLALGSIVAAVVGMVQRYRRAVGLEREQLKLFVTAVVVAVVAMVANGALIAVLGEHNIPTWLVAGLLIFAAALLSVTIGVAILQHRLFDINVVISKTIVYGLLAIVVTGLYVAFVVGIGALVGRGNEPNLGLSIAATAIAAIAFQPLRTRAQHFANRLVYGRRATPYEILSHLSDQLRDVYASEDLLVHMARSMAEGTGARQARVWMRTEDLLWTAASWPLDLPRREARVEGSEVPPLDDATLVVPVRHWGDLLGALSITKAANDPLTTTEERLVTDLGAQAGLVLRNARLTQELLARLEELKASRQRLVKAQDDERRRLERDLHDGAQQLLVALKIKAGLIAKLASDPQLRQMAEELAHDTGDALDNVRDLARGIYPPLLASDGLVAALRAQAAKSTIPVNIEADGIGRYPQEAEAAVYFCVLEALQNIQKYARANGAVVTLGADDSTLRFTVRDDGVGFDPAQVRAGSGMQNMRDRLAALDGEVQITSTPGAGTTVTGRVLLERSD